MTVHDDEPRFQLSAAARKRAPNPRQSAKEAYRQGILAAAELEFARAGFAAVKMADVARAAGVAVGTLYNYFDSKGEIFEQIIAQRCAEMRASLSEALRGGTPLQNVGALVRNSLENLERQGALFAIFVERGAVAEYDLERIAGQLAQQEYQRFLDILGDVLRAAVESGDLRKDIPVPTMVAALSGALNGATYSWLKRRRRGRLVAFADDLLALFLAGARK
jgi:AcrR family transcriptional regulator